MKNKVDIEYRMSKIMVEVQLPKCIICGKKINEKEAAYQTVTCYSDGRIPEIVYEHIIHYI